MDELDVLFKEADLARDLIVEQKKNKVEAERKKAVEMRKQSLETYSETRKRTSDECFSPPTSTKRMKKTEPIIEYLKEKNRTNHRIPEREKRGRERITRKRIVSSRKRNGGTRKGTKTIRVTNAADDANDVGSARSAKSDVDAAF